MRNKKIVAFILFFSMILTSVPVFGATDTSGHWAEESIEKLEANKIMSGYSDGNFRPNKAITFGKAAEPDEVRDDAPRKEPSLAELWDAIP